MNILTLSDGNTLISTARFAIRNHLLGKTLPPATDDNSRLSAHLGVFVTLSTNSISRELRGCIGNPFPKSSLLNETARCAVDAATMDPRFKPISSNEFLRNIVVEVTVLSALDYLSVKNPLDLPLNVKVGRDGLLVEGEGTRGLLLPQVGVDEGFDEEEFLNECCLKAGLMPDAWLAGQVRVARFQGQIFSEKSPMGQVFERKLNG